jgi:hypothetical protein
MTARFFDKGTYMRALWHSEIIERVSKSEEFRLADLGQLDTPEARQEPMKGTVEDWGDQEPADRQVSLSGGRD